jgi:hypothetical protein
MAPNFPEGEQFPDFVFPLGERIQAWWEMVGDRMEPVAIRIVAPEGRALTAAYIRGLPIGKALRDMRAMYVAEAEMYDEPGAAERYGSHRGVALSETDLRQVAEVYLQAFRVGEPVTAAVADAFQIPKSTAAKRIMSARRRGFLPPARANEGQAR